MTLSLKEDSLNIDPFEKHAIAAQMLSQMILSSNQKSEDKFMNSEEFQIAFSKASESLQNSDPLAYNTIIEKVSNSVDPLDSTIIQSIDIHLFNVLIDAIFIFKDNDKCIFNSFLCISELSLIESFRDFFFSNNIFQISFDALDSENHNISLNALKVMSIMIELAIKNETQFDMNNLIVKLNSNNQKSRDHEFYVIMTLTSIVEYSDFSEYYESIIDILCYISVETNSEKNVSALGNIISLIIKKNFNYFFHIHLRLGITGVLLEQLNENTIITQDIFFAIPILQIVLCVIHNLKKNNLEMAIQFSSLISFENYEKLIRESIVEVSELALQIVSFLLVHNPNYWLDLCVKNKLIQTVISKFIDEAPFYKKYVGIKFLSSVSKVIKNINDLNLLLGLNVIEKCSFSLDCDDLNALTQYLKLIRNLLYLSSSLNATKLILQINEDITNLNVFESSHEFIENLSVDNEPEIQNKIRFILQILNSIKLKL